jgi:hypothetical protein
VARKTIYRAKDLIEVQLAIERVKTLLVAEATKLRSEYEKKSAYGKYKLTKFKPSWEFVLKLLPAEVPCRAGDPALPKPTSLPPTSVEAEGKKGVLSTDVENVGKEKPHTSKTRAKRRATDETKHAGEDVTVDRDNSDETAAIREKSNSQNNPLEMENETNVKVWKAKINLWWGQFCAVKGTSDLLWQSSISLYDRLILLKTMGDLKKRAQELKRQLLLDCSEITPALNDVDKKYESYRPSCEFMMKSFSISPPDSSTVTSQAIETSTALLVNPLPLIGDKKQTEVSPQLSPFHKFSKESLIEWKARIQKWWDVFVSLKGGSSFLFFNSVNLYLSLQKKKKITWVKLKPQCVIIEQSLLNEARKIQERDDKEGYSDVYQYVMQLSESPNQPSPAPSRHSKAGKKEQKPKSNKKESSAIVQPAQPAYLQKLQLQLVPPQVPATTMKVDSSLSLSSGDTQTTTKNVIRK